MKESPRNKRFSSRWKINKHLLIECYNKCVVIVTVKLFFSKNELSTDFADDVWHRYHKQWRIIDSDAPTSYYGKKTLEFQLWNTLDKPLLVRTDFDLEFWKTKGQEFYTAVKELAETRYGYKVLDDT